MVKIIYQFCAILAWVVVADLFFGVRAIHSFPQAVVVVAIGTMIHLIVDKIYTWRNPPNETNA